MTQPNTIIHPTTHNGRQPINQNVKKTRHATGNLIVDRVVRLLAVGVEEPRVVLQENADHKHEGLVHNVQEPDEAGKGA